MTREEAHKLLDMLFDGAEELQITQPDVAKEERKLPEGQRVVRTKSSGDRVYLLDDNKKSRQWVTNPEVLGKLGFDQSDVQDVEDGELLKYNMGAALYRVE